jgi:hypothetical protein
MGTMMRNVQRPSGEVAPGQNFSGCRAERQPKAIAENLFVRLTLHAHWHRLNGDQTKQCCERSAVSPERHPRTVVSGYCLADADPGYSRTLVASLGNQEVPRPKCGFFFQNDAFKCAVRRLAHAE